MKGYLGDLPEAETYYRSAIRLAPLQADYHRLLAEFCIQYQIKLDQTALPAAREALRLAPQDPANQDVLGQVLFITGDRAGALQAYQAALALDEQYAPANLHLGVLYSEMGETSLAFELLQRAHSSSTDPAIQDQAARLLAYFFP